MPKIKCKKTVYQRAKAGKLNVDATAIKNGVYGYPMLFTMPPVTQAVFLALITSYTDTYGTYKDGGSAQKGFYEAAMQALLEAMDLNASYVDTVADGDPNIITQAGYVPTKGSYSETPIPAQPTGVIMTRGILGVLYAECENVPFATSYISILTANQPLPPNVALNAVGQIVFSDSGANAMNNENIVSQGRIDINASRKKTFKNLVPGVTYYVAFVAINSAGVSGISLSVGLLCG